MTSPSPLGALVFGVQLDGSGLRVSTSDYGEFTRRVPLVMRECGIRLHELRPTDDLDRIRGNPLLDPAIVADTITRLQAERDFYRFPDGYVPTDFVEAGEAPSE